MRGSGPMRLATIACLAYAGLAWLGARPLLAQGAAGDEPPAAPVTLVDPDAAPFSSAELTQALLARLLTGDAGATTVQVSPAGPGQVTVRVGKRSRVVELGDRTGPGAARVVALVIAELASSNPAEGDVETPGAPIVTVGGSSRTAPPVPSAPPVRSAPPVPSDPSVPAVEAVAAEPPASGPPLRFTLTGGVSKGLGHEELLNAGADADVAVPIGPEGFRLVPAAGVLFSTTRNAGTFDQVSYQAVVARLLAGRSWQYGDVLGGALVEPYRIQGTDPHASVLVGAEALARITYPIAPRVRLVVSGRFDAFANRVRTVFVDNGAYATPRLAVVAGAGAAWDWGP
jgi:hypothetical protein